VGAADFLGAIHVQQSRAEVNPESDTSAHRIIARIDQECGTLRFLMEFGRGLQGES
jgi:hypothetical protein